MSAHLHLGLRSGSFPRYPTKILHTPLLSPYMSRGQAMPFFIFHLNIWRGVQVMKLVIMQSSPSPVTSSLSGPNIYLSTLYSTRLTPQVMNWIINHITFHRIKLHV
jgi:hypothetical protein